MKTQDTDSLSIHRGERRVAYFSMEVGIDSSMPTYSGGLGVLAGDTIKAFADLRVPAVAVTLLYWRGYFRQLLDKSGAQQELLVQWDPSDHCTLLETKTEVVLSGRTVVLRAWRYACIGRDGFEVPIIFLDTNCEENSDYDRHITDSLYGGDDEYRLTQEAVLGIGGLRMLAALGFNGIERYHMNEGHSSLLALELLRQRPERGAIEEVRDLCVFTTHTPVPAGHDKFQYSLVQKVLGEFYPVALLRVIGGSDVLNMTLLALNLSRYVNGVAREHSKVSREMFPGYKINAVTNGIHVQSWAHPAFAALFSEYIPQWKSEPSSLRYALSLPEQKIEGAHRASKRDLIGFVKESTGVTLEEDALTIGFARRATAYKRADLIFHDREQLQAIVRKEGKLQFVFSGKAHPRDHDGKSIIKELYSMQSMLSGHIPVAYIQDYNMETARRVVSGVDLWLNTPRKPKEASGTSGMKAALNGVPSLSILDGWWVEGCIEGVTGWAIGSASDQANNDANDAQSLYAKLENTIMPLYYRQRDEWIAIMRFAIAINASFFNAYRMVHEYVLSAYYLTGKRSKEPQYSVR